MLSQINCIGIGMKISAKMCGLYFGFCSNLVLCYFNRNVRHRSHSTSSSGSSSDDSDSDSSDSDSDSSASDTNNNTKDKPARPPAAQSPSSSPKVRFQTL